MQPLMVFNKQPPLFEKTIFIFPLANSCSLLFCPQTLKEQQGNEKQTHLQRSFQKMKKKNTTLHKYIKMYFILRILLHV